MSKTSSLWRIEEAAQTKVTQCIFPFFKKLGRRDHVPEEQMQRLHSEWLSAAVASQTLRNEWVHTQQGDQCSGEETASWY